jgi:hypothetical protein
VARHHNLLLVIDGRHVAGSRKTTRLYWLVLVLAVIGIVYCAVLITFAGEIVDNKQRSAAVSWPVEDRRLPIPVSEMRDAILAAVHSGQIEDLKAAIDWNELKPDFGEAHGSDPVLHLKQLSNDPMDARSWQRSRISSRLDRPRSRSGVILRIPPFMFGRISRSARSMICRRERKSISTGSCRRPR